MNKRILHFARFAGMLAASVLLNGFAALAADDATPPPAQPAQPAQPDANAPGGGRGNRGNRGGGGGNFQGGNAQGGNFQGGRGNFGGGGGGAAGGRNFGGFGGLNLDDKQNELLREAMQADSDELRKLTEKLQAAQKELLKAVIAEKYDEPAVRGKAEAVAKIQTEITMLRAKAFATVSPTLKAEQREQLEGSRVAISFISGTAIGFGGGNAGFGGNGGPGGPGFQPQDPQQDRAFRRNNNNGGGDPTQTRRRGGGGPPGPGQ
jgi:Spy/CpxP family protein refolding chaperone